MKIESLYKPRAVRKLGLIEHDGWAIKTYSISVKNKVVKDELLGFAKGQLSEWLKKSNNYNLPTYKIATMIIHEGREGIFTLLNWWVGDNMIQNHVYFSTYEEPEKFESFSENGMMACIWELAVIWHDRNAWIKHVLSKIENPDYAAYLNDYLNGDV
jgi:hypothetical protein